MVNLGTGQANIDFNIVQAIAKLTQLQNEVKKAMGKIELTVGDSFQNIGAKMQSIGAEFTRYLTVPITNFAKDTMRVGTEFEKQMSMVQAITQKSAEEMDNLRNKAKQVGEDTVFTATEVASAEEALARAGWEEQEIISGLDGLVNIALADNMELNNAAEILSDTIVGFGHKASDAYNESTNMAEHFADVLAQTSASSNTNIALIGESMKYVAPLAGALKYSIDDVAVALEAMANVGIKGSSAGTGLRMALQRMIAPTKEVTGEMVKLGLITEQSAAKISNEKIDRAQGKVEKQTLAVEKAQNALNKAVQKYGVNSAEAIQAQHNYELQTSNLERAQNGLNDAMQGEMEVIKNNNVLMFDAAGNAKPFAEVLQTLRDKFKGLSQEEQTSAAATIFGVRAMSGMLGILNASDEVFQQYIDNIKGADGAAAEMAKTMQNNVASQMKLLNSQIDAFKLSLYDAFLPAINDIMKAVNNFMKWLNGLDDATKKNIATIALLVAAIGPLLIIFGKIISSIGILMNSILALRNTFVNLKQAMDLLKAGQTALAASHSKLMGAFLSLKNAASALWAVLLANPLVALAAAIAAVAAGLTVYYIATDKTRKSLIEANKAAEDLRKTEEAETKTLKELKEARQKNIDSAKAEYDVNKNHIEQLKNIVDENGKVKKGYEQRVNAIIPLLEKATGTEIKLINGQIQGYNDLIKTLDQVIEKKRAEAEINAYASDYEDAIKNKRENAKLLDKTIRESTKLAEEIKALENSSDKQDHIRAQNLRNQMANLDASIAEMRKQDVEYRSTMEEYEDLMGKFYTKYGSSETSKLTPTIDLSGIDTAFTNIDGKSEDLADGISTNISNGISNGVSNGLSDIDSKVENKTKNIGTTISNTIVAGVQNGLSKGLDTSKNKIDVHQIPKELIEQYGPAAAEMMEKLNIAPIVKEGTDAASEQISTIENKVNEVGETIASFGPPIADAANEIGNAVTNNIQNVTNELSNAAPVITEQLTGIASQLSESLSSSMLPLVQQLVDTVQNVILERAPQFHTIIYDDIIKHLTNTYNQLVEWLNIKIQELMQMLALAIQTAGQVAINAAKNLGLNIARGIAEGIRDGTSYIIEAVQAALEAALEAAEDEEEIESPSKKWNRRIGKMDALGIGVGFVENIGTSIEMMKHALNTGLESIFDEQGGLIPLTLDSALGYGGLSGQSKVSQAMVGNGSTGGDTFYFYSPEVIDEIKAAKLVKQTKKDLADGFF